MKLSVVIVNYNVRAYLEQCLRTVFQAMDGLTGEVFVVDNQSTDGSVEMVRDKFPQVKLIANRENVGFSRANNQAIRMSNSEYVLLLNPDTVVGEEVFRRVVRFLDDHPRAGGLGVKMIDGTGRFLPESKRGLPTPAVAFFKIIGITRLLPRSRVFGRYHLGHLAENDTARIEILSGACMFLRRETLNKVGLLDESFFMYGEDIDLSYRITLGGYENWYFPEARIIHYKGESTKKSSVNYVFVFYNAMAIFAKKHFTRKSPDLLAGLINASIYLSAAGAIIARFLGHAMLAILDTLVLFVGFAFIIDHTVIGSFGMGWTGTVSIWCAIAVISLALAGGYDRPVRLVNALKGAALALPLFLLAANWVHQAGDLRLEAIPAALLMLALTGGVRIVLHAARFKTYRLRQSDRRHVLAMGSREESRHALALLWQTHFGLGLQEQVQPSDPEDPHQIRAMRKLIRSQSMDEMVFCARDLSWGRIVQWMEALRLSRVEFKIAQPGREFIIGPSSIESLQDLQILERHAVHSSASRRGKRIVDVMVALAILITLPVSIWFVERKRSFFLNWWKVIAGTMSWVGYHPGVVTAVKLPSIKQGVIDPVIARRLAEVPLVISRVNTTYAKDYNALEDIELVWRGFSRLGG